MSATLRDLQSNIRIFFMNRHSDNVRDTSVGSQPLPPFISMDNDGNYYDNRENTPRLSVLEQNILNLYILTQLQSAERHGERLRNINNGITTQTNIVPEPVTPPPMLPGINSSRQNNGGRRKNSSKKYKKNSSKKSNKNKKQSKKQKRS